MSMKSGPRQLLVSASLGSWSAVLCLVPHLFLVGSLLSASVLVLEPLSLAASPFSWPAYTESLMTVGREVGSGRVKKDTDISGV